jgi:uncharacterized membrane protein
MSDVIYDWLLFGHVLAAMVWLGGGVLVAVAVLAVVAAVLAVGARGPLAAALRELRSAR